jgi:hypothetical protein
MNINVVTRVLTGALALGLVSCSSDDGGTTGAIDAPPTVSGPYTHYVTDGVTIAPPSAQGFDLNGDGTVDNKVGGVFALAGAAGLDVGGVLNASLAQGVFVLLHSVHAASLTTAAPATWQVYLGTAFTDAQTDAGMAPDFSGSGTFTLASGGPTDAVVPGSITAGAFAGGPGTISIQLAFSTGAPPVTLNLKGAKIAGQVTADGCSNAKLGGGILVSELEGQVYPSLATIFNAQVTANGCTTNTNCPTGGPVAPCTAGQCQLASFLDTNKDGMIDATDIKTSVVGLSLPPDLDLVANVNNPNNASDPKESVSLGIGFTCVKATFTASNEH